MEVESVPLPIDERERKITRLEIERQARALEHQRDEARKALEQAQKAQVLRDDPTTTPEALLAAVEAMLAGRRWGLSAYARGALALVERTTYFERASAIARAGMDAVEALAAAKKAAGVPAEVIQAERAPELAELSDALGAALLAQGRLVEAGVALRMANLLVPGEPRYLARQAAIVEREGDPETARAQLLDCREIAVGDRSRHPCELGLASRYHAHRAPGRPAAVFSRPGPTSRRAQGRGRAR